MVLCHGAYRVAVDTPNLEDLFYIGYIKGEPLVKNLKSLVQAYLFPFSDKTVRNRDDECLCSRCVSKFLNVMSNTKSLTLITMSLESLLHSSCSLPKFQNLTYMKLVPRHNCCWELLPILLQSTPALKALALDMEFPDDHPPKRLEFRVEQNEPVCLAQHLTKVDIFNFKGVESDFDLLKYLLLHGEVLERITFSVSRNIGSSNWSDAVWKKLSKLQKSSKKCQLIFP